MITAFYASLAALWIYSLTFKVIKARRKNKVAFGDNQVDELLRARSAHSNAVENSLIILLLLFALEFNGGYTWLIHLFGLTLLIGRYIHGNAMLAHDLKKRVLGMQFTVFTALGLVISNLLFLPYAKLFSLMPS